MVTRDPHPTTERCTRCATPAELAAALNRRGWHRPLHTVDAPPCPYEVDPGPPGANS